LYNKEDLIQRIESGDENLDDLYLHVVDIWDKRRNP
jgi:hypothetical protein